MHTRWYSDIHSLTRKAARLHHTGHNYFFTNRKDHTMYITCMYFQENYYNAAMASNNNNNYIMSHNNDNSNNTNATYSYAWIEITVQGADPNAFLVDSHTW